MVRGKIDLMIAVMPVKNDDNSYDDNKNNIDKEEVQLWTSLLWTTSRLQDRVPAQNMWISSYRLRRYKRISKKREKAVTTLVKKYDIFSRVLISPIKCWHVTRVSHHWLKLMKEWQIFHHFQSVVVLSECSRIMAAETRKNPYRLFS